MNNEPVEKRPPVILRRRKVTVVNFPRPEGSFFACRKRVITPKSCNTHALKKDHSRKMTHSQSLKYPI